MARRYYWAGKYCRDKDTLEVACGTGQGFGYLASLARSVTAGDCSEPLLEIARQHYGARVDFRQFDAEQMPFADAAFDVVLIFEALYYLPDAERFFRECRRVLRPSGVLLIASANKDLFDFNPSPHSTRYFGVVELGEIHAGTDLRPIFGDTPVGAGLSAPTAVASDQGVGRLGLIPETMQARSCLSG